MQAVGADIGTTAAIRKTEMQYFHTTTPVFILVLLPNNRSIFNHWSDYNAEILAPLAESSIDTTIYVNLTLVDITVRRMIPGL